MQRSWGGPSVECLRVRGQKGRARVLRQEHEQIIRHPQTKAGGSDFTSQTM